MGHHGLEHDEFSSPRKREALRAMLVGMGVDPATASLNEVQDAVYLAQVAGFDLGYRFEWRPRRRREVSMGERDMRRCDCGFVWDADEWEGGDMECPSCSGAVTRRSNRREAARAGDICPDCDGTGRKIYPSTATWRGGIGGHAMRRDVCDRCWGTGQPGEPGLNLREHERRLRAEVEVRRAAVGLPVLMPAPARMEVSMGERMRASEYPCGDARWDCSEWRGRVGLALLLETAAHLERAVDARRYMDGDSLWQPTGERVRVYPDGTVQRIDDGGE